jgi:hypothetical protein
MTSGHPGADIEALVSPAVPGVGREHVREHVTVRRRRARTGHERSRASGRWVAASRSRRRAVRTFALCTGVLLLMAIGLYFGLAHQQNAAPAEGAVRVRAVGAISAT